MRTYSLAELSHGDIAFDKRIGEFAKVVEDNNGKWYSLIDESEIDADAQVFTVSDMDEQPSVN